MTLMSQIINLFVVDFVRQDTSLVHIVIMKIVHKLFSIILFFHEIPSYSSRNEHGNIVGDPVKVKRLVELSLDLNKTINLFKEDFRCYSNQSIFIDVLQILGSIFRLYIIYEFHIRFWHTKVS